MTDATTTGLGLVIPILAADVSTLDAAQAYAADGFYVGPLRRKTKNPGSRLGDDWNLQTSRDLQMITGWFAGTDDGIFLHAGRSGAMFFDVDKPDKLHPEIKRAIDEYYPPYQSTRTNHPGRRHYGFKMPEGRRFGNALGKLGSGWGEIRGLNGVIVVEPSEHEESEGRYKWLQTGPLPVLPSYVADLLPDVEDAAEAATDAEVAAFLAQYQDEERPGLLGIQIAAWQKKVAAGESRHSTVMGHIAGAMKEAKAGLINAEYAAIAFQTVFEPAVMQHPAGPKQGKARTAAEARNEWQGILAWAVAQGSASDPAKTRERVEREVPSNPLDGLYNGPMPSANGSAPHGQSAPPAPAEPTSLILPASFYSERDVLRDIRDYAHSRGAPADPVLYAVLARISGMVPPKCTLETGIGRRTGASLNLFVAAVGPSGTGKSSSAGVAGDLYQASPLMDFRDGLPLGSGEGLGEAYMGWIEEETGEELKSGPNKGEPKRVKVRKQVRHNAFFVADEGEAFTKLQERAGSTLGAVIRSAWYGATIGSQNGDSERTRILYAGSYSMGMLIGFQPETVLPLLNDGANGTPQRFVYCYTVDHTLPTQRPASIDDIGQEIFQAQAATMALAASVADEVWDHHNRRSRGELTVPRLDAHGHLTRLKLAALLALLAGRHTVLEDDWRLAEIMWETSCRVREEMLQQGRNAEAREKAKRTRAYVEREGLAEGARQEARDASAKVVRVARLVARYVHDTAKPSRTIGEVTRRLDSRNRPLAALAIDYAASAGWVIQDDTSLEPGESLPSEAGH